ncbi:ABC transporter ATP-binding protein [Schlesneria paludicola]|uniref:ABC transporter ATP-binding protein n=1 Tax=Schlesneria paludicola TaxID=360056 RepID=UPI00029A65D0|nr:ATP-binding cassette domain-containing protein [Schlesneria paludicola]
MTFVETAQASSASSANSAAHQPLMRVQNLSVRFGTQEILRSLSFDLMPGQTLVILGESGCGKTTLMRALAGLIPVTNGEIQVNSVSVARQGSRDRGIIYLDQEPLLFEHLNVTENIAFALRLRRMAAKKVADAVTLMLQEIDLCLHARKREWQLSGGQKQRVAFARAILAHPQLLLLDEPFCSLDSQSRNQMQQLFSRLSRQHSLTSIFVTHDVKEALVVGDCFARMTTGNLLIYPDRRSFMIDPATGIPAEIAFWQKSATQRE